MNKLGERVSFTKLKYMTRLFTWVFSFVVLYSLIFNAVFSWSFSHNSLPTSCLRHFQAWHLLRVFLLRISLVAVYPMQVILFPFGFAYLYSSTAYIQSKLLVCSKKRFQTVSHSKVLSVYSGVNKVPVENNFDISCMWLACKG